jgi:hypothetical protein
MPSGVFWSLKSFDVPSGESSNPGANGLQPTSIKMNGMEIIMIFIEVLAVRA